MTAQSRSRSPEQAGEVRRCQGREAIGGAVCRGCWHLPRIPLVPFSAPAGTGDGCLCADRFHLRYPHGSAAQPEGFVGNWLSTLQGGPEGPEVSEFQAAGVHGCIPTGCAVLCVAPQVTHSLGLLTSCLTFPLPRWAFRTLFRNELPSSRLRIFAGI